ncbi:MAG: LPXTG cell wall anchor domain-containing protein [Oscillospiraceae bacterium]|nr:LPXTG cell wall anchor domain-containing protein [Oscillospiraceae bacterium]
MKKLITCLTVLSMILASVPAAAVQAEAAEKKAPAAAAETVQAASPADLTGRWFLQEGGESTGYVMVYEDGTYSYYSYAKNTAYGGTVTIEYDEHPDGTASEIYSFYDNSGEFRFGCRKPDTGSDVLPIGQDGSAMLVKDTADYETACAADIAGSYSYQVLSEQSGEYEADGTVTVSEDGTYTYTDAKGSVSSVGTITVSYDVYPDGSTNIWYTFRDTASGGCFANCCASDDVGVFISGQDGAVRLVSDAAVPVAEMTAPAALTGKWLVKNSGGQTEGALTVDENGSFICITGSYENGNMVNTVGTVSVIDESDQGSTEAPLFLFRNTETDTVFLTGTLYKEDTIALEDGGRLVRDDSVRRAEGTDICGEWILKNQIIMPEWGMTGEYEEAGTVTVSYDEETGCAVYTCRGSNSDSVQTGKVTASYQMFPDCSVQIWYCFYDSNGEFWIGAQESSADNRNTLTVGQTGEQILTHAEAVPNDYGFYDAEDVPESGAGVTALNGEWINPYVLFGNWEGCAVSFLFDSYCPYAGSFTMTVSENDMQDLTAFGSVRLQYQLDGDGSRTYYYVLYAGEEVFLMFDVNGDLPLDEIRTAGEDPLIFTRQDAPYDADDNLQLYDAVVAPAGLSTQNLAGEWQQTDCETETILRFTHSADTNARFVLITYADGSVESVSEGLAKLQYFYTLSGERAYLYALYVADEQGEFNQILMTLSADDELPRNELQLSNMDIRFERIADAPQAYTYSDDQLMDMALNDYEAKHGIRPDSASVVTVLDGIPVPEDEAVIVLSDENGSDLDYYTVNADTGVGTNSASEPVNLPQTGNNSLKNLLIMAGALLMTVFGVFTVRQSGKLRRREEQ